MTLSEISVKYNVTVEFLKEQLVLGTQTEFDLGSDVDSAEQIARDNISKQPDYYKLLTEDTCR